MKVRGHHVAKADRHGVRALLIFLGGLPASDTKVILRSLERLNWERLEPSGAEHNDGEQIPVQKRAREQKNGNKQPEPKTCAARSWEGVDPIGGGCLFSG